MPRKPVYSGKRRKYAVCNAVHTRAHDGNNFAPPGPAVNRIVE